MNGPAPLGLLAELTHRCPMRCVYCSNPLALEPASRELDTGTWQRVLGEAAALGVLQVQFSGGEPLARDDLPALIAHAAASGLYTNLITSGVMLGAATAGMLARAGLEHVQLSFQDTDVAEGERIGGLAGAHARKLAAAAAVRAAGMALTLNVVLHRGNLSRVETLIALAVELGASRLELAHVQYHGWAQANRQALLPARAEVDAVTLLVERARSDLARRLVIDYVPPDLHARLPKACMGGWGQRFLVVDPSGRVLPCHAATTIPDLVFTTVHEAPLADIWSASPAFQRFRGTAWMPEPCASCERREIDWGGCRCQALALAGDAAVTDPVCHKSPRHAELARRIAAEAEGGPATLVYRALRAAGQARLQAARSRLPAGE